MSRFPSDYESCEQIIAPDGSYDAAAVDQLDLDDDELRSIYESMITARALNDRGMLLQRRGDLHFWEECEGEEGTAVGAGAALGPDDWMQTAWREYGMHIHRGRSIVDILLFWLRGYEEWPDEYDDVGDLPTHLRRVPKIVAVGTQVPQAVGLMWGRKYQGADDVGLVTVGDGATSKGDFHEGLNFAGVLDIPIVFLCINNQWAISLPAERQTAAESFAQKAPGYGFDGALVDGNDPLAVYRATSDAVEKARVENEPTLVEALTYRRGAHSTSDDPSTYRDETESEAWAERDPIDRYETFLEDRGLWTEEYGTSVREDADARVQEAAEEALERASEQTPDEVFDQVYANPPSKIRDQWKEFDAFHERHGDEVFREG